MGSQIIAKIKLIDDSTYDAQLEALKALEDVDIKGDGYDDLKNGFFNFSMSRVNGSWTGNSLEFTVSIPDQYLGTMAEGDNGNTFVLGQTESPWIARNLLNFIDTIKSSTNLKHVTWVNDLNAEGSLDSDNTDALYYNEADLYTVPADGDKFNETYSETAIEKYIATQTGYDSEDIIYAYTTNGVETRYSIFLTSTVSNTANTTLIDEIKNGSHKVIPGCDAAKKDRIEKYLQDNNLTNNYKIEEVDGTDTGTPATFTIGIFIPKSQVRQYQAGLETAIRGTPPSPEAGTTPLRYTQTSGQYHTNEDDPDDYTFKFEPITDATENQKGRYYKITITLDPMDSDMPLFEANSLKEESERGEIVMYINHDGTFAEEPTFYSQAGHWWADDSDAVLAVRMGHSDRQITAIKTPLPLTQFDKDEYVMVDEDTPTDAYRTRSNQYFTILDEILTGVGAQYKTSLGPILEGVKTNLKNLQKGVDTVPFTTPATAVAPLASPTQAFNALLTLVTSENKIWGQSGTYELPNMPSPADDYTIKIEKTNEDEATRGTYKVSFAFDPDDDSDWAGMGFTYNSIEEEAQRGTLTFYLDDNGKIATWNEIKESRTYTYSRVYWTHDTTESDSDTSLYWAPYNTEVAPYQFSNTEQQLSWMGHTNSNSSFYASNPNYPGYTMRVTPDFYTNLALTVLENELKAWEGATESSDKTTNIDILKYLMTMVDSYRP